MSAKAQQKRVARDLIVETISHYVQVLDRDDLITLSVTFAAMVAGKFSLSELHAWQRRLAAGKVTGPIMEQIMQIGLGR